MQIISRPSRRWLSLTLGFFILHYGTAYALDSSGEPAEANETNSEAISSYKKMSLQELMNQDVTSVAKEPQPYKDAPASIDVITSEDIQRSGASSLPEALRLADNLDVEQLSSSQWDISARGFNTSGYSDKMLVLMDGRSIYSPLLAGVIWNLQDYFLPDIDRIEAISGPGGTLWGANAVNGVINIMTKSAKDTQGLYVEAGGGSWLQDFGGFRYGGVLSSNIYYRVYGKYFDYGPEHYADGTSAHDSWNRGDGGFRIDADGSPDNLYTLEGQILGGDNDAAPGGEGYPVQEGTSGDGNIMGRWTHTISDDADTQLQVYYDRTHLGAPFQSITNGTGPGAIVVPEGQLRDDLDTADIMFQNRFTIGDRDNVVWGLEYRFTHNVDDAAPLADFLPNTLNQNFYSGFVQDQIRLLDNVYFTGGSKLEHNDYTGFEWEPSARLQWNITGSQMVWGAISRSVRMPSEYDRNLFEPSPNYFLFLGTSNSTFESETVIAYELGYRAQITKYVSGSLSAFFNDYDHLRSLTASPGIIPLYWANEDRGETWGFELSVNYQPFDWWRLNLGYDFIQENIYVENSAHLSDLDGGYENTADPENQVFLRSSMDLPYHLQLDANGRWIDSAQFLNGSAVATVPDYFELDLSLGWHITKNLEASITGQNLLRAQHIEAPASSAAAQEDIVRSVYGKLSWHF